MTKNKSNAVSFFRVKDFSKKGFSLIEFLVVIVVLGTLATIILVNLGNAGGKANRAAFIEEAAGSIPGIMTLCANNKDLGINLIEDTDNIKWTQVYSSNCGSGSNVTFCVRARNKKEFTKTAVNDCIVSVNESGKIFRGGVCNSDNILESNDCK